MRNGSKLRRTVVISLSHFTLVALFVVLIGTPAAWPDTPGTVLEMTANRFLHSRSFPFPSSSLVPIPLGIPSPWTVVLLATFPLGPFLRLHLLLGSWNSPLAHIRSIDTLSTFKRHLNFHLFQSACTVQSSCASASDSFSRFLALYKFVRMHGVYSPNPELPSAKFLHIPRATRCRTADCRDFVVENAYNMCAW